MGEEESGLKEGGGEWKKDAGKKAEGAGDRDRGLEEGKIGRAARRERSWGWRGGQGEKGRQHGEGGREGRGGAEPRSARV